MKYQTVEYQEYQERTNTLNALTDAQMRYLQAIANNPVKYHGQYQICKYTTTEKARKDGTIKTIVDALDSVTYTIADSQKDVYDTLHTAEKGYTYRVYPMVYTTDGQSVKAYAQCIVNSWINYMIRNDPDPTNQNSRNNHATALARLDSYEMENLVSTATLATLQTMAENPSIDMYSLSKIVRNSIDSQWVTEYRRGVKMDNFDKLQNCAYAPVVAIPTNPDIDNYIWDAVKRIKDGLHANHRIVLDGLMAGTTMADIARALKKVKSTIYRTRDTALYHVFQEMENTVNSALRQTVVDVLEYQYFTLQHQRTALFQELEKYQKLAEMAIDNALTENVNSVNPLAGMCYLETVSISERKAEDVSTNISQIDADIADVSAEMDKLENISDFQIFCQEMGISDETAETIGTALAKKARIKTRSKKH